MVYGPATGVLRQQTLPTKEGRSEAQVIGRRSPEGPAPLSFAQERLWFLDQLEPGSALYNIPIGLRMKGALNASVLDQCLDEIVRRHEALRTRFEAVEGQPRQVVEPIASLGIPVVDLSGLPEEQREAEALRLCTEEARCPFDLARGPLVRARLLRLGQADHVFFLNMHHIASDACSVGVLMRELKALYVAFSEGRPSPLPELPVQYADYAAWQREWLQGEVLAKQLGYWRKQLEGAPGPLELPTDRPRPATQRYHGARLSYVLPGPLLPALGELSRQEGGSLFMTLLAAFQVLLHRYSGQEDVLVGATVAGRSRRELEGLIGSFGNTLVLRGDLSAQPTFRTLLGRTREAVLGGYAHQDLAFERLLEELPRQRDLSHSPFFQVMFVWQDARWEVAELAGLEVSLMPIDSGTSKFDLTLFVNERAGALQIAVEYNTDLFEAETIRRMLGHYQTLLEGIGSNPAQRLSEFTILTERERYQLLVEWNQTQVDYPKDRCLHQLLEEQVERTPDAVAVVFDGQQLTYRELNHRANQLAGHLHTLGVGPDILVGVCMKRSLEMMVALYGILKAGGAYLPLDPSYPKERLAFMLEDSRTPVLLTHTVLLPRLPSVPAKVVCLDESVPTGVPCAARPTAAPGNLAYVIYTSGSTGKPKGAMITQQGLVNYLTWAAKAYKVAEGDGAPIHSSISFDLTITGLFTPLLVGSCVHMLPEDLGVSALSHCLRHGRNLSLVKITPAHLDVLSGELGPQEVPGRTRAFIIGGEALQGESVSLWQDHAPDTVLVNEYGPTETVVGCCVYFVPRGRRFSGTIPIGRPIANTQLYVLDSHLQPVPIGVKGELYIAGDGVARGYLNQPDLTAEKFLANPFSPGTMYKSGDLARYLPDGNLECLGRLDHQVKIHGFRIELGEIESVLAGHAAVREAVVIAREDRPGDRGLVAYIVAKNGPALASDLRAFLRQKLPGHMIPGLLVFLEKLPLTPNGKVDRKALPAPKVEGLETRPDYAEPRTPIEKVLAGIWCEVLGLKQVGAHDNFFELGGHSLLAVKVQARLDRQLGKRLPLATFFQAPTVVELAASLEDGSPSARDSHVFAPQHAGSKRPLFCLHFLSAAQHLNKHLGPTWPVYGIESPYENELRRWHEHHRLELTMEELAARCVAMIRGVQPTGPYHLTGVCFGGVLAFEIATQLTSQGEQVPLLAVLDALYEPGCVQRSSPWARRMAHHIRQFGQEGFVYVTTKLAAKLKIAKRRRLQLERFRQQKPQPGLAETESIRLPQTQFQDEMLKPYRGKPYFGGAVLIRGSAQPHFGLDPGATSGWGAVIQGRLQVEELCCGHADISEEPHVGEVAKRLRHCLLEIEAK